MRPPAPIPAEVQEAFARFWAAYPERVDNPRKPALRVFADLVGAGVDAEVLVRAASAYRAHVKANATAQKFIPHARTWLNQDRYEEWMAADVPASAPDAGPNPEHPLFPLFDMVGRDRWASYIAPLIVSHTADGVVIAAPTNFALSRVRDGWGRDIEAVLGPVSWTVRKDRADG